MARKTYRRNRRTRRHSRRHRGGAGAPNPSSYTSASSYGEAVVGDMNSQYNRVFDISSSDGANQSNTIVGLQGQRAGKKRRGGSRRKRGGLWGEVINQAVVPLTLLGMQQRYGKRGMTTRRRR